MIIKCHRCGKPIESPDNSNADYIIADDTKAIDTVEVLEAVLDDEKESRVQVKDFKEAGKIANKKRVEVVERNVEVQKTGIICPDCYKPTDIVIWGVHRR